MKLSRRQGQGETKAKEVVREIGDEIEDRGVGVPGKGKREDGCRCGNEEKKKKKEKKKNERRRSEADDQGPGHPPGTNKELPFDCN